MIALSITATGSNITTGAATALAAIPVSASGGLPNYVRLSCTVACYAKVGPSSVTATAGDILIMPSDAVTLFVKGCTHVAGIQAAAAGVLNIVPVENL